MFHSPHIQTLWSPLFRSLPRFERRLSRLELAGGDHCWLHWAGPPAEQTDRLVVILHGLSGSSDSPHVVGLQHQLYQQGLASVVVNGRGAGGRPNDCAKNYHAGETSDLKQAVDSLIQAYPELPLFLVGFSLGGSRLLNYLALAENVPAAVRGAVTVCVPLDLAACEVRMNQGFSKVYRNHLIGELVKSFRDKLPHLQQVAPNEAHKLEQLGDFSTIIRFRDYDNRIVCPLFGFKDADEYYAHCSAQSKLHQIRVPTLMIQGYDDPFMTPETLPKTGHLSDFIQLEVRDGGHVGFVDGLPWKSRFWLEQRIPEFFAAL